MLRSNGAGKMPALQFMKSDRLKQVESLYHAVLDLKKGERQPFLEKARKHDAELVVEVQSLLAFEDESEEFIEQTAVFAF